MVPSFLSQYTHIMFDWETFGVDAHAWPHSFACRFFDPFEATQEGPVFQCHFNQHFMTPPRNKNRRTLDWWDSRGGVPSIPPGSVVYDDMSKFTTDFERWAAFVQTTTNKPIMRWSRGIMDEMLRNEAVTGTSIFHYQNFQDLRSFERDYNWSGEDTMRLGMGEVAHTAIADVDYQIKIVQAIVRERIK